MAGWPDGPFGYSNRFALFNELLNFQDAILNSGFQTLTIFVHKFFPKIKLVAQ
jgi:hypothetical protein